MTWTTKPRDDAFRAMCKKAMAARAAASEAPPLIAITDATLPLVTPHRDGILKLGRRRLEAWCETEDWTNEDWWHLMVLAACAMFVSFALVVILAS